MSKGIQLQSLRTAKTGSDVTCPIPTKLAKSITAVGPRPFWTGNSTTDACASLWRKVFADAFEQARVDGHPHQFRHVFEKRLLMSGVPVGLVSVLLGHSKVSTTERHYSKWVRERQSCCRTPSASRGKKRKIRGIRRISGTRTAHKLPTPKKPTKSLIFLGIFGGAGGNRTQAPC
jgi:Phage integrase family